MNSPASPDAIPRYQRIALMLTMFLSTASMGYLQPFIPLYLDASGLKQGQIGLVMGVGTGMALLIQPLIGRFSDFLDLRRPLMGVASIVAAVAYLSYRTAHSLPVFILLSALGSNAMMYLSTAGAVLVGRLSAGSGRGGATYARYRIWGSVGYIVISLLSGWLVFRAGGAHSKMGRSELAPVFTYGPLLFLVIALVTQFVPDRRQSVVEDAPPAGERKAARHGLPRNLQRFLIAYFLYMFGLYGASAYLSQFMKSLGASPLWITAMFSAGVFCEVLVMRHVGHFTDRYGRRPALALTFCLMPLRLLLYIPASGPLWVLFVQMLHGLNFGIMGTIAVVFVNDIAIEANRGAAQARLAAIAGLATALSPPTCGLLAQHLGYPWMFTLMALVGTAGALVFLTQVQETHSAAAALADRGPLPLRPLLRLLDAPPARFTPPAGDLSVEESRSR